MAGGFVSSNGRGKEYPGKLKGYVLFTCILAAMGGLIFGYDIGISVYNISTSVDFIGRDMPSEEDGDLGTGSFKNEETSWGREGCEAMVWPKNC